MLFLIILNIIDTKLFFNKVDFTYKALIIVPDMRLVLIAFLKFVYGGGVFSFRLHL